MGRFVCIAVSVLLLQSSALFAQSGAEILTRIFQVKPKSGMEMQFEEALKKHSEWHREQKDTWTWNVFQIDTGDAFGQYVILSPGHRWADFDAHAEFTQRDMLHAITTMGPYFDSVLSWITRIHPDISMMPGGMILDPLTYPLVQIVRYQIKPGKFADFIHFAGRVHEALSKASWPQSYFWSQVLSGGPANTLNLVLPARKWEDMKEPEKSVPVVLEEVLGRQESERLIRTFQDSVESVDTRIMRFRPDLSYQPPR